MTITKSEVQRLRIVGAMRTDVGRVRSANEDTVVFVAPAEGSPEGKLGYLALVADGMGGHAAGEVASAVAAEVIRRIFYSSEAASAIGAEICVRDGQSSDFRSRRAGAGFQRDGDDLHGDRDTRRSILARPCWRHAGLFAARWRADAAFRRSDAARAIGSRWRHDRSRSRK